MIFNINSTRGQTRFLTCVALVTSLVIIIQIKPVVGKHATYMIVPSPLHPVARRDPPAPSCQRPFLKKQATNSCHEQDNDIMDLVHLRSETAGEQPGLVIR